MVKLYLCPFSAPINEKQLLVRDLSYQVNIHKVNQWMTLITVGSFTTMLSIA